MVGLWDRRSALLCAGLHITTGIIVARFKPFDRCSATRIFRSTWETSRSKPPSALNEAVPALFKAGDRVRVLLETEFWLSTGWFEGTVERVDRYSAHRSFYWVDLDAEVESLHGGKTRSVSVLNPKHILRI
jgi:hypothetical protein